MRTLAVLVAAIIAVLCWAYGIAQWPEQRRYNERQALCSTWTCPAPSRPLLLELHDRPNICVCVPPQEQGWID